MVKVRTWDRERPTLLCCYGLKKDLDLGRKAKSVPYTTIRVRVMLMIRVRVRVWVPVRRARVGFKIGVGVRMMVRDPG